MAMQWQQANDIAVSLVDKLAPYCQKVQIAGSVRRGKPEVKDLEIVCIPRMTQTYNLLGEPLLSSPAWQNDLNAILGAVQLKGGEKYKQFELPQGINLDLFCVTPPAQWGLIFTMRTGPWQFSNWVVTQRAKGGALPSFAKVRGGAVIAYDEVMPMPEEMDFLNFCQLGWIEPKDRAPRWGSHRIPDAPTSELEDAYEV